MKNIINLRSIQYSQILSDLTTWLSNSVGNIKSINKSTVFGQLLTALAGVAHNIFLYIEDALVEQNKYSAQRKKSIYGLAAHSGYVPSYGSASGAWINLSHRASNRQPLDVVLPNHTQLVCSENGLIYNIILSQDNQIIKCDLNSSMQQYWVVQGSFMTQTFSSQGGPLSSINIKYTGYIDTTYITVKVNGSVWTQRDSLYDMNPEENAWTLIYNPIDGLDILFGNGMYGHQLEEGDSISVEYLTHDGSAGNIEDPGNAYFSFVTQLKDIAGDEVDGNNAFYISFANEDSVSSGSDPEDINVVKNMIGFNSRALVLADSNAYSAFLSKFSFVGYNRTWAESGSLIVHSLIMRNYSLDMSTGLDYFTISSSAASNKLSNKFLLSETQKDSIRNAILNSGMQIAGTSYDIIDIELCRYALFIYVKLKGSAGDHSSIETKIRTSIGEFFGSELPSDSYIPKSDIIKKLKDDIEEIDGLTCYFLSEANETAILNKKYTTQLKRYDPVSGSYKYGDYVEVTVAEGENPMLGLDAHGNILLESDTQFPVLAGGWNWKNSENQTIVVSDPLTIVFE